METIGRVKSLTRDYESGKYILSVEADDDIRIEYERLKGKDIQFVGKVYRKKRTISANALMWEYVAKLATKLGISNQRCYNTLVNSYGVPMAIDNKVVYIPLPDTDKAAIDALESETVHLKSTPNTIVNKEGKTFRYYILMQGTSQYNSEQMSRVIDGLMQECEDQEIDTRSDYDRYLEGINGKHTPEE